MAEISAKAVKELREKTGAGMMDCKRALTEADGDLQRAVEVLRERGLAKAGKREGRATSEGVVAISRAGRVGGIVELGCETDFVARTDEFVRLGEALARAVADDASLTSVDALRSASLDGEKVSDRITAAIATLGENIALKRVGRLEVPGEGLVGGYVHAGGKLGVIVGLATAETGAEIEALAKDVAMHVAAADPTPVAVSRDGVPEELLARERAIYQVQAEQEGKPAKVIEKIVEGRIQKFIRDVCLVEQPFVKDTDRSVGDLLEQAGGVRVTAFCRFRLGQDEEEASTG